MAAALLLSGVLLSAPARAQFVPYYGKNKVHYDTFAWRVYRSPHFEVFYYPTFERHLGRIVSTAESAYQRVSTTLKHTLPSPVPLVLYKTHSEFEQTSLFPTFLPEGVAAFAEPSRGRMVLPVDGPPDRLYGLIVHELTHVFAFDLIPRGLAQANVPLWVDEGLADYMRGQWDALDLMTLRDAALADQVPRLSRFSELGQSNARLVYNLGHAGFEFIAARYGKEGIRQFLYTLRKNPGRSGMDEVLKASFRLSDVEFDDAFEKWLRERFKPFRDKQPASDYGRDLAPNGETSSLSQVYAFSPSPSGELIAALTGNHSDGEADIVLLAANDGSLVRNLTKGYSDRYESISFSDRFAAGRSIGFAPGGDSVAFFARTGDGRSLFLVSVLSGKIERRVPVALDLPQSPCLLPGGKAALLMGMRDGVSDIFRLTFDTGALENLTQDAFADADPQVSPDGTLAAYTRRISGYDKVMVFALDDPARKTQVTFGAHDDVAPAFTPDGRSLVYSSSEDGEIPNIRRIDLATGAVFQYTDTLGGNMAPAVLKGHEGERLAFISYFKGLYRLQVLALGEPLKEIDQEVQVAQAEPVDFQPDVTHSILPENKRGKRLFEKFLLDGRPPVNVGVTSGGDFFGGSQLSFSDVLGEKSLLLSAFSEREYRTYNATFVSLSRRLQWGLTGFDTTVWGYADPYGYLQATFSRDGALVTQRLTGAQAFAIYPLDKLRRVEVAAGLLHETSGYASVEAAAFLQEQAALFGYQTYLSRGTILPVAVNLVQETTRFHDFGPLSGSTYRLGVQYSPPGRGLLSRLTLDVDARKYFRIMPGLVFAVRVRGFRSSGPNPDYFFFGGNMELRGYDYRSFSGTEGFFGNAELRLPLIDVMKTPIGLLGPVRGAVFAGVGGARWKGQPFRFGTSAPGYSYVNDNVFGEAVSGYRLVDGRASFGAGLQFFFLGYPLHFDWVKLTDLRVVSKQTRFSFWIGFDF